MAIQACHSYNDNRCAQCDLAEHMLSYLYETGSSEGNERAPTELLLSMLPVMLATISSRLPHAPSFPSLQEILKCPVVVLVLTTRYVIVLSHCSLGFWVHKALLPPLWLYPRASLL